MKKKTSILVVEDNGIVSMDICKRLDNLGYIIAGTASSGQDAIEKVKTANPDLVLMDIVLKGEMDGIEAAETIYSRLKIPVVFITAHADEESFERAKLTSPFGYIIKPFRNREFQITIKIALYKAHIDSKRRMAECALKKSEKKYRSMMEIMINAICICSSEFRLEYMNSSMIKMIGYDATGEKCYKAIHNQDEICKWCTNRDFKDGDIKEYNITSTKNNRFYHVTQLAVIQENGSLSTMNIYHDLTELKNIEKQLIQAQKMEAVGRLAGGVAHDYNNALSVIMGFTELALGRIPPSDPVREDLAEVLIAARRASDITRQLLAFARKQTISPQVINLNSTVDSILKMLRRLIGEDIHFEWVFGSKLWNIKMDPVQVDQVLMNLCVNSRDAISDVGKIIIETKNIVLDNEFCRQRNGLNPGEFVQLTISDNGTGIDKELQKNIFEPFFTTKAKDKGTGLGLSTVYGIVKQNKGFISCYSEPGTGTTFSIYFPKYSDKKDKPGHEVIKELPTGQGETIILVEDDQSILKLIHKMLDDLNYKVITNDSPANALAIVKNYEGRIDLLITDVIMPEMNGKELSNKLKKLFPDLKCLYISGYTADVIAHHGILEDGIHFIQKPFSKKEIAEKVSLLINE